VSDAAVGEEDDGKRSFCYRNGRSVSAEPQNLFIAPVMSSLIPHGASAAVLKQSEPVPDEAVAVQGPNFDERPTLETLLDSYERIGFQANSLGKAINIVNKMVGAPLLLSLSV
jgi:hypothetical protein